MIKVLVADDDQRIRTLIETNIDWSNLGCEIIASVSDGIEALDTAKKITPDILITDIHMPNMNGLELLSELTRLKIRCKTILITSFQVFEYARTALSYGVRDYFIKPLDFELLNKAVKKLALEISDENRMALENEQLRAKIDTSLPLLRDKLLNDLLFGTGNGLNNVQARLNYFGIQLDRFAIAVLVPDSYYAITYNLTENEKLILTFLIINEIQNMEEETGRELIACVQNEKIYLFIQASEDEQLYHITDLCAELGQCIKERGHFSVSIGVSTIYESPENVWIARNEAEKCLAQCRFLGENCILCYNDIFSNSSNYDMLENITQSWFHALQNGSDMQEKSEALYASVLTLDDSYASKTKIAEIIITSVSIFSNEYGENIKIKEYILDLMNIFVYTDSKMDEYFNVLRSCCNYLQNQIIAKISSSNSIIIQEAIRFMENNCNRDVSLDEVADHINRSKWYLSKLFKKETGKNFNEYMTELRIEYAKKVLIEKPKLKNYEIAEQLGFSSAHYFAQLFKSMTGFTPSEFRR